MSISIFAKEAFLNINPHEPFKRRKKPVPKGRGHLLRVSSIIRGDQIADQIGAKYNPESGYENDTCIYVKPYFQKNQSPKDDPVFMGKKVYLDIIDGHNLAMLAQRHPEVGVIVCSQADYKVMSKELSNKIIYIPQHHCNFDREKRTRKEVKVVGMIGTKTAIDFLPNGLVKKIEELGFEFKFFHRFFTRADIVDFYKQIDIQIVWRPYKKILSNPLKLVNATSFGIPTVALDEKAFWEVRGCYIPVNKTESLLAHLITLREKPEVYEQFAHNCILKSEDYHIEKVGEMYKELDDN